MIAKSAPKVANFVTKIVNYSSRQPKISKFGDLVRVIDLGHVFALAVYKLLLKHVIIVFKEHL